MPLSPQKTQVKPFSQKVLSLAELRFKGIPEHSLFPCFQALTNLPAGTLAPNLTKLTVRRSYIQFQNLEKLQSSVA